MKSLAKIPAPFSKVAICKACENVYKRYEPEVCGNCGETEFEIFLRSEEVFGALHSAKQIVYSAGTFKEETKNRKLFSENDGNSFITAFQVKDLAKKLKMM